MAEDATFNIVIGVQNRERIKQLEKDISDAEKEINNLTTAINAAGQATTQQANQLRMYGRDIGFASEEIKKLSKENIELGQASDTGGIGVRTLTREMFRLEEGGAGLLKVIPMMVDQLGGGAGLAAGFALATAAIEVTSKHWDDLMDSFSGQTGIEAAKTAFERLSDTFKGSAFGETFGGIFARGAQVEADKAMLARVEEKNKRQEQKGKAIAESLTPEEEKRGGIFTKAAKEYGGQRLEDEMVERQSRGKNLSQTQIEEVRRRVKQQTGQAAEGKLPEGVKAELFGPEFGKEEEKQQQKADFLLEQKARREESTERKAGEAQIESNKRLAEHQTKEWGDEAEKAFRRQEQDNRELKERKVQDQILMLERQKKQQAEGFQEQQLMAGSYGLQGDTRQMMAKMMQDTGKEVQLQQLQTQKKMQEGIDVMRDELKKLNREGIAARAGGI